MMGWLKDRLAEPNTRRAIAYGIALLGYYGLVNPQALEAAGMTVERTITLLAIVDGFVTRQAPKA